MIQKKLYRIFNDHPASVGETYLQHFQHASAFGARMMAGGAACILHGVLPFLFVKTGSKQIRDVAWARWWSTAARCPNR